ncbi:MAG: aspartyl protease family protein [Pseudomonadota bacterium]
MQRVAASVAWLLGVCATGALAEQKAPAWIEEGPYFPAGQVELEIPIQVFADKLYLSVDIGGSPRRFVFDTGSPSMISASLAEALELPVVDRRSGIDAHGNIVESDIVQVDLSIAGQVFHRLPAFAADFDQSPAAQCFIGDGVLGADVLPLCAWQVDRSAGVLRCHTHRETLPGLEYAKALRLYDFGYPHIPFVDVQYSEHARSKVMIDTGATGLFALSQADHDGIKKHDDFRNVGRGQGSAGSSLGGPAPDRPQVRVLLDSVTLESLDLGPVVASVRPIPPSLLGAPLFRQYRVTLDVSSQQAFLEPVGTTPEVSTNLGFQLGFDDEVSVALVWEDSPAAKAGLKVGQSITAINGQSTDTSCDGMRFALEAMSGDTIELAWPGGSATLTRAPWPN